METLLGTTDASRPLQWWGYLRGDGTPILKRYGAMHELEQAQEKDGARYVRGPFIAFGRGAALARLRDKLAIAKTKTAQRRLEAMVPERLS